MIYKDINALTTPLLYYLGLIFLEILGANYFTYRIYNFAIITSLYISLYIVFRKINIDKIYAAFYTILIMEISNVLIGVGANYNVMAMFFTILGIILKIEKYKNNKTIKYYNLYEGILIFLIIFTKQNIGAYYVISGIIIELLINKRKGIINLVKQAIISIIPIVIWCAYLLYNNALYNFIDYTILGMGEFSVKNIFLYKNYIPVYIILAIYIVITLIKKKEKSIEIKILLPYTITYFMICYPILEYFHSMIGGLLLIVTFIYLIHMEFISEFDIDKTIRYITIIFIILLLMKSIILFSLFMKKKDWVERNSVYYGTCYTEEVDGVERVTNYIRNSKEKVIILCPQSALYNMALGIDNGILDLPTQGNVGRNGAQKIINTLEMQKDVKILIDKEKMFWQEFDDVRNWVMNNSELVGEIEGSGIIFDIYYIKK